MTKKELNRAINKLAMERDQLTEELEEKINSITTEYDAKLNEIDNAMEDLEFEAYGYQG